MPAGAITWKADINAFGQANVDGASTVTNHLRLPGQYYDAETGLHYNWRRYYDPVTGRYTTKNPIRYRWWTQSVRLRVSRPAKRV